MAEGRILVARQSVMFDFEGQKVFLRQGVTTAREGHPVLKGREELWEPLVPTFETQAGQEAPREAPKPPAPQETAKAPAPKAQQATRLRASQKTA